VLADRGWKHQPAKLIRRNVRVGGAQIRSSIVMFKLVPFFIRFAVQEMLADCV
jgi:hypothetical protein